MIRELEGGKIQLTLDEQRWYYLSDGTPCPSVTWILEYMPKGHWFYVWLADKMQSYDEVRQLMQDRGQEGTMVHWAMERYLRNDKVSYTDEYPDFKRSFTPREWEMVLAGKRWCDEFEPLVKFLEVPVFQTEGNAYAGTVDKVVLIEGEKFAYKKGKDIILPYGEGQIQVISDWKSSQAIYLSHKVQVSAYAMTEELVNDTAVISIVRLGSKHKSGYEFWHAGAEEQMNLFNLFESAYTFWQYDNPNPAPKIIEVPMSITQAEEPKKLIDILGDDESQDEIPF